MVCELRMVFTCLKIVQTKNRDSVCGLKHSEYLFSDFIGNACQVLPYSRVKALRESMGEWNRRVKERENKKGILRKRVQVILRTKLIYFVSVSYKNSNSKSKKTF